jgi:hypothetical protein
MNLVALSAPDDEGRYVPALGKGGSDTGLMNVIASSEESRARLVLRLPKGFASALLFVAYLEGGGPWDVDRVAERALGRALGAKGVA